MAEVHVTLVEQGDFAALQTGAQFVRPLVVVLGGGVHNDETGQQTLQVQAHVGLGRRLAPTVLGPVRTVGHQFHHRAVDHMDGHLETKGRPPAFSCRKAGRLLRQMIQDPPKKLFGHGG